ncbi:MAG: twin-arginine translocase TatA/TatE family subunit [Chloroflexi bacterium]|nr:twin-arginine translocase TatA/TatE family subunit [Chloroflexota bacterium]
MELGPLEIALIVVAIVLIFGVGKLGQIGGALGKSIHDFRKEKDRTDDLPQASTAGSNAQMAVIQPEARTATWKSCSNCGFQMSENAKFCMSCGTKI